MRVELELWQLITLLITFLGASAGAVRLILMQTLKHLDARFENMDAASQERKERLKDRLDLLEQSVREDLGSWQRVERDMLQLKADLPHKYVMREDYIRGQSLIEAKLDALAGKVDNWQFRTNGGNK